MTTLATDAWGGVHVFWAQGPTGDIQKDAALNYIYYTSWNGETWSSPRDIISGPEWASYHHPGAAVGASGRIYLTWSGPSGIYFSSALVAEAEDAKQWRSPELVVELSRPGRVALALGPEGTVHVAYTALDAGTNVMYLRSDDEGRTWSEPVPVSSLVVGDPQVPDFPDLTVDGQGTLHMVWAENYAPEWVGRQVLYGRSDDGGHSWSPPLALSESSVGTGDWNATANLAVDAAGRLHVVWVCGSVKRCYRSSDDGGSNWSSARRIFDDLLGVSGHDDMATDAYGNVYWLGALREPQGVYFSRLAADGAWQDPPVLLLDPAGDGALGGAHFFHLVVGQGNTLNGVMVSSDKGPVWHLRGHTNLPALVNPAATVIPPTPGPTPGPTLGAATAQPTERAAPVGTQSTPAGPVSSTGALLWGVGAVLVLAAGVIVITLVRRR